MESTHLFSRDFSDVTQVHLDRHMRPEETQEEEMRGEDDGEYRVCQVARVPTCLSVVARRDRQRAHKVKYGLL